MATGSDSPACTKSAVNAVLATVAATILGKAEPGESDVDSPEQHLLRVGRVATVTVVTLGILWIPVMERVQGGGLYQYLQNVQGYVAPPIAAVFLLGLFW